MASTNAISRDHIYGRTVSLVGVNHRTLHIAQREKLAQMGYGGSELTRKIAGECDLKEAAVLSTCNRFEVISVGDDANSRIESFLKSVIDGLQVGEATYSLRNAEAVKHFFRVTSSLDSMVLGEPQIVGQVKEAYAAAVQAGVAGRHLHYLFQFAFHLAKSVRSNTGVAEKGVSVSYIAVKLAQQIFGDFKDLSVLVLGSGKMAELAALHLKAYGCCNIIVANRSIERASLLARQIEGLAVSLSDVDGLLSRVDIVIGSIAIDRPILEVNTVRRRQSSNPLFLIDLGIPRNFSPALAELSSVYLYNIDDLSDIAHKNSGLREEAAKDAEVVIDYGVCQFERWLRKLSAQPLILDIRSKVQSICRSELERQLQRVVEHSQLEKFLPELSYRVSQKISHEVTRLLEGTVGGKLDYETMVAQVLSELLEV